MFRRHLPALVLILLFSLGQALANPQGGAPSSEEAKTRLDKKEITDLMSQGARLSARQQEAKLAAILKSQSESKTPRSDFLFCMGLAYLGNVKAQACVAKAYESGIGIVEDRIETYVWDSIAAEADPKLESERERVKTKLQTAYPFPSDEDLENQLSKQKEQIKQYQTEMKK
jgi:hypothetical protein